MRIRIIPLLMLAGILSCERDNNPPEVAFTVSPPGGSTRTLFDFDATATEDPDGLKSLISYRWDCNGDGVWDTDFGPWRVFSWRYDQPGTYVVVLQVKDGYGAVSSREITVQVDPPRFITDPRDGKAYPVIRLGGIWWLAKNLDYGKEVDVSAELTSGNEIEKYVYPGNDPDNLFGGLYTWDELMNGEETEGATGICPPGWRIPSVSNWAGMLAVFRRPAPYSSLTYQVWGEKFVPDQTVVHDNFQSVGAAQRLLRETGSTGFDAILLGYRDPDGVFGESDYHFPGKTASFWTSTTSGPQAVRIRIYQTLHYESDIFRFNENRQFAFSVRCVRDSL